jgi:multidrug efflux pump subunit AcrA (membrane-fusion protein)
MIPVNTIATLQLQALRGGAALCCFTAATILPTLVFSGCKKDAPAPVEVSVQVEQTEQGSISERITADAVLAPIAQAAIEPKITAPVKKFYVQRGSSVKEGALLATLENADLAAAAQDSKGSYEAAEAAFATTTQAQVPEDAQRAELDLAQAQANLELNESIVKSRKQLFEQGAIPGRDLDTAQAALVQARAAYNTAKTHLESIQKVSREAALKAAQGQLTSAAGKLRGANAQVSYSEIRSPISGVVTDRPLFAGETAAAGAPLITVMDTSSLLAKAHLAQNVAQRMKLGDAAEVNVPGMEQAVKAKVSMISPALDPGSTTVEVWLKIGNKNGVLRAGTPVKIVITGKTIAQAWKIPLAAVLTAQDGGKSVMVIGADGSAHRKTVTLGITDGVDVQVLSGLAATDQVITVGAYGLDEGTKVKAGKAGADDDNKPAAAKDGDK